MSTKKKILLLCMDIDIAIEVQKELLRMKMTDDVIVIRNAEQLQQHKNVDVSAVVMQFVKEQPINKETIQKLLQPVQSKSVDYMTDKPKYNNRSPFPHNSSRKAHYRGNHRF